MPGLVKAIEQHSVAERMDLRAGDLVFSINGHALRDVIDAQFYGADDQLEIEFERNGERHTARSQRDFGQSLGIEFDHPTFDIDIRRCNNHCPFCFVLQNAPKMRRTLYIKDDDFRYSFMFGHFVTLTNLADEDWTRLAEQRLSPLYVSVHATDVETRHKCLRSDRAVDVVAQLRWLADHGIEVHTQLVITPGVNDGAQLEKSVHDLAALHPHVLSISVVPVGLTKHHKFGHRPHTREETVVILDQVEAWQREYLHSLGTRFVFATDEWYLVAGRPVPSKRAYEHHNLQANGLGMVRDFLNEWRRVRSAELKRGERLNQHSQPRGALLATATLFAPTLTKVAKQFTRDTGVPLRVIPIVNERLGESITVAGLLSGADIIHQFKQHDNLLQDCDIIILPRVTFDHPDGIAIDDVSPGAIARALNKPVALADWMGDVVDALHGHNKLTFAPDAGDAEIPIVREGGWAVEKYL